MACNPWMRLVFGGARSIVYCDRPGEGSLKKTVVGNSEQKSSAESSEELFSVQCISVVRGN